MNDIVVYSVAMIKSHKAGNDLSIIVQKEMLLIVFHRVHLLS